MNVSDRRQLSRSALHAKGLRATPARIAILGALEDCSGPISHLELATKLDDLGLDKSTIFRGLQDLTEVGLLHRLELGDHVWRYELCLEDAAMQKKHQEHLHPHLLCVVCGAVHCISQQDIEIQLSPRLGKIVDVLIKGHCQGCVLNVPVVGT